MGLQYIVVFKDIYKLACKKKHHKKAVKTIEKVVMKFNVKNSISDGLNSYHIRFNLAYSNILEEEKSLGRDSLHALGQLVI